MESRFELSSNKNIDTTFNHKICVHMIKLPITGKSQYHYLKKSEFRTLPEVCFQGPTKLVEVHTAQRDTVVSTSVPLLSHMHTGKGHTAGCPCLHRVALFIDHIYLYPCFQAIFPD